jgi:ribosomal protein S18 acetylase RimI-like enzyme
MVEVSSDVVADAIVDTMRTWLSASDSSWGKSNGVEWCKSARPSAAFFNVVFARGADVTATDLDVAVASYAAPEWNFRVEARPEALEAVGAWASANGREPQPEELSWLLTDPGALDVCRDSSHDSATRRLSPGQMYEHREVFAPVFGMDPTVGDPIATDALLEVPGVFVRVAEVDGVLAGTAMSIVTDTGGIGVFAVAVGEQFRRRGIGRAVTAAVIGDGLEYGGTWSFLEASDEARAIYQRMGFQPIDGWHSFPLAKQAAPPSADA